MLFLTCFQWKCVWLYRPGVNIQCLPQGSLPYFLKQGLALNLKCTDFVWIGWPKAPGIYACLLSSGIIDGYCYIMIFTWVLIANEVFLLSLLIKSKYTEI